MPCPRIIFYLITPGCRFNVLFCNTLGSGSTALYSALCRANFGSTKFMFCKEP